MEIRGKILDQKCGITLWYAVEVIRYTKPMYDKPMLYVSNENTFAQRILEGDVNAKITLAQDGTIYVGEEHLDASTLKTIYDTPDMFGSFFGF